MFSEEDSLITDTKGSAGILKRNGEHDSYISLDKDSRKSFHFQKPFMCSVLQQCWLAIWIFHWLGWTPHSSSQVSDLMRMGPAGTWFRSVLSPTFKASALWRSCFLGPVCIVQKEQKGIQGQAKLKTLSTYDILWESLQLAPCSEF